MSPERLRPARSRPCDRVKQIAVPVTFSRSASHPFARPGLRPPSRGHAGACYPPRFLGLPRGSPRTWWQDASRRSLQPTNDTCTRRFVRFPGAVACATADRGVLRRCYPTSPARHQTTLRQSGPGSYALDGAQTSFGNARSHRFRMRLAIGEPLPRVIDVVGVVHHPAPAFSAGAPGRRAFL